MSGHRVTRLFRGASLAEKAAEAIGIGVQHRAVLDQGCRRLVELEQKDGHGCGRRDDVQEAGARWGRHLRISRPDPHRHDVDSGARRGVGSPAQ